MFDDKGRVCILAVSELEALDENISTALKYVCNCKGESASACNFLFIHKKNGKLTLHDNTVVPTQRSISKHSMFD